MAKIEKSYESLEACLIDSDHDRRAIVPMVKTTTAFDSPCAWNGGLSFSDTVKLARMGWDEGVVKIVKFISLFEAKLGSRLVIDEYFYDVTGQDFDLDRVLIGEPEAWLNSEQVTVNSPALQVLKVVVNIGARGTLSPETIIRKGAAILALVSLLEKARRKVEIELISFASQSGQDYFPSRGYFPEASTMVKVTIKKASMDMDLAKLAFCLIHPGMLRRIVFAIREKYNSLWCNKSDQVGWSFDCEVPDADILVNSADGGSSANWNTNESAENWILEQLKAQGVELKREA